VRVIDFDDVFKQFDGSETLFVNIVHTTPAGDEKIADRYFEAIKQDVIEGRYT
jgi:hypothetical protein